jgi:hypothetical protein
MVLGDGNRNWSPDLFYVTTITLPAVDSSFPFCASVKTESRNKVKGYSRLN